MSELLQPGLHPDADTLAAFAEDALPAHERESTLGHLALCAHCRQVVTLSLPPVEELQPAIVVQPHRRPASWRWLWAGAAACAGLALASVALLRHPPAPAAVARVEPPPAATLAPPPAQAVLAAPPLAKVPPLLAARPAAPAPPKAANVPGTAQPPLAKATPTGGVVAPEADKKSLRGLDHALKPEVPTGVAQARPQRQAQAELAPAPPPLAAPVPAPNRDSIAVTANAAPIAIDRSEGVLEQLIDVNQKDRLPELPSHLAASSRYADGKRVLAADTAGTLFFSKDGGRHWTSVKPSWKGQVLQVSAGSAEARARTPAPAEPPASPLRSDAAAGNASLGGLVRDASGAVVPGSSVTVSGMGVQLRVLADRSGLYAVRGLAPGEYRLRVDMPGFLTAEGKTTVGPAQQAVQNVTLNVGSDSQTVEVTADATSIPVKPPPSFALRTSTGERWVSADGKHWTRD